jgi:hypothetical protein
MEQQAQLERQERQAQRDLLGHLVAVERQEQEQMLFFGKMDK